jgi:hypothetical protein
MKRKYSVYSFLFGVCCWNVSLGQVSTAILDTNNVQATINSNGYLFNDWVNFAPGLEIPRGTSIHSVYTGSLWMGGLSATGGQLHLAGQYYSPNVDYGTGPIATTYDSVQRIPYQRLWKLSRLVVDKHISDYNKPGYVVPEVIENWPAHGDTMLGEAHQLAPFYDKNGDGVYQPALGDYPCIRGDQSIYSMLNDGEHPHGSTGGMPLGVEVHMEAYAFNTIDEINNVAFLHFRLINRSSEMYTEFYTGLWLDFDMGCALDDRLGCDTNRNLYYVYNGDAFDEDCSGAKGNGSVPPAFGAVFLNQQMSTFIAQQNGPNDYGEPINAAHFYNYLRGFWKNNNALSIGGNGTSPGTPTTFMYPGEPGNGAEWTDISDSPGDRKGIGAIGPFDFAPGQTIEFDMALVYARAITAPNSYSSVATLKAAVDKTQQFFETTATGCSVPPVGVNEVETTRDLLLFPNPVHDRLHFVSAVFDQPVQRINVYNSLGEQVLEQKSKRNYIEVQQLPEGLYFLELEGKEFHTIERFVIHHP